MVDRRTPNPRSRLSRDPFAIAWLIVIVYGVLTATLIRTAGLSVEGFSRLLVTVTVIAVLAAAYGVSGRSRKISQMAHWALLWIVFATSSGILTYATASLSGPLVDADLARIDASLGLSWTQWHQFIVGAPSLRFALAVVYVTLLPQIIFSLLYFGLKGRNTRNAEFFFLAAGSLFVTIMVAWRFPSLGAAAFHGFPEDVDRLYLADLQQLRAHTLHRVSVPDLEGIIQFPSFHTTLALIFPFIHRDSPRLFWPILGLNAILLVAIPVGGGHHFTDMIGGAAIGIAAIGLAWAIGRRTAPGAAVPA